MPFSGRNRGIGRLSSSWQGTWQRTALLARPQLQIALSLASISF
jgi:hypothetical protein